MGKRKTILVDGYNVIRRIPEFSKFESRSLEAGRQRLETVCRAWKARRPELSELVIVFDGDSSVQAYEPHQNRSSGVTVMFTGSGEKADTRILKIVAQTGRNDECTVVSDDNEVSHGSKLLGARVASVAEFHSWVTAIQSRVEKAAERDAPKSALTPAQQRTITESLMREWGVD